MVAETVVNDGVSDVDIAPAPEMRMLVDGEIPKYDNGMMLAFQTPLVTVPSVFIELWPTYAASIDMVGLPDEPFPLEISI